MNTKRTFLTRARAVISQQRPRRRTLGRLSGLCALAAALAAGAPAAAQANAITLGSGQQPDVAIDSSGTAYIAWNSTDGSTLYYCRLPESASSCTPTTLPVSDSASARPAVFVNGSTVQVLTNRCCSSGSQTELFTSTDGGASFGPPVVVGNLNPSGDAVSGPGNGISLITSALINSYYQRVPTDGSPPATAQVPLSSQYTYHGVIGLSSGKPVVVFDDLNNLAWTTTNGSDPNQGASWQGVQQIAAGHDPHIANGPNGLYLASTNSAGNLELRKFTGSGWSSPNTVASSRGPVVGAVDSFAQGPTGSLAIVFRTTTANPTDLDFTGSTDAQQWSAPQPIATDSAIANLRVSEAPNDGTGVAVWDNGSTVSAARHPVPTAPPPPSSLAPPQAAFTYRVSGPLCAPVTGAKTVYFDASTSTPGSSPIVSYSWYFFDPAAVDQTLASYGAQQDSFEKDSTSAAPTTSFDYQYTAVLGPDPLAQAYGLGIPEQVVVADAIFGTLVRLVVTNADGLTSTVRQLLPFRDPVIDFQAPPSVAPCFGTSDLTHPLTLTSPSVTLLGGSTVAVPFACRAVTLCGGLVTLRTITGSSAAAASVASAARARTTGVVVGRVRFALASGHRLVVRIKLNARGRALARLGDLHKLQVTVTAVHLGRSGKPATVSRVVRVRRGRGR